MPSTITSHGYKIPQDKDRKTWWGDLIFNFLRLNSHKHDGVDSVKLDGKSIEKPYQDIASAGWTPAGGGHFQIIVTTPVGVDIRKNPPIFVAASGDHDGCLINLSYDYITADSYTLKCSAEIAIKVLYV